MSSQPNQKKPIVKDRLLHFQNWLSNRAEPFQANQVEEYLAEYPLPKMMDVHELAEMWRDARTDYDMGLRRGIAGTIEVFTGEEVMK